MQILDWAKKALQGQTRKLIVATSALVLKTEQYQRGGWNIKMVAWAVDHPVNMI